MTRRIVRSCFQLSLWFATAQLALATTLQQMDLDDLTAESQAVVYGRITARRAEWDRDHRFIYTIYTVQPLEYLKGNLGRSFELQEPGGERDGLMMRVPSVPEFAVGQEQVLFVWTDPRGRHQATGFEQGAVEVLTDPGSGERYVNRDIRLGSARMRSRSGSRDATTSRRLTQLFEQIRVSAAQTSSLSVKEAQ